MVNQETDQNHMDGTSFRGNYSFLNLALCTVTFDLYFIHLNGCRGNYSRGKLYAEIRYSKIEQKQHKFWRIISEIYFNFISVMHNMHIWAGAEL